jgi:hypothetical protein
MPSLFEARCRLPTSATETRRASNQTGTLADPRRDGGLDLLPSLTRRASSLRKRRHVASRATPVRSAPVLVPPTRVGLPSRDTESSASPRSALDASTRVRIDVHGSKDRVKDAFCRTQATISRACAGAYALWRMRDDVPLLGDLRTSAVIGASDLTGGYPRSETDRPRPRFRRHPAKDGAFHATRMPCTVTTREGVTRRE